MSVVKGLMGGGGPSAAALKAQQDAAARKERDKMALERAGQESSAMALMQKQGQSKRAFASQIIDPVAESKKRFLKAL